MSNRAAAARRLGLRVLLLKSELPKGIPDKESAHALHEAGYSVPYHEHQKEDFRALLCRLDVVAFTPESVARYKKRKLLWLNLPLRLRYGFEVFGVLSMVVAVVLAIVLFFAEFIVQDGITSHPWFAALLGMFLFGAATAVVANRYVDVLPEAVWRIVPLKEYHEPIPRPILDTITMIHRELPEAHFRIHRLEQRHHTSERFEWELLLDPFLEVVHGQESYIIAVWDEPDYKAEPLV